MIPGEGFAVHSPQMEAPFKPSSFASARKMFLAPFLEKTIKTSQKELVFSFILKPVLKPGDGYLKRNYPKGMKGIAMKTKLNTLVLSISKINREHIQVFFIVLSLAMLVLGVGAPDDGGHSSR
jgi:hypothetical protein